MKNKILAGGVLCTFLITGVSVSMNAEELVKYSTHTDATASYSACTDQYHSTKTTDGGTLAYGCDTFGVNESYSTYSHSGTTSYRGRVETGNGNVGTGAWTSNNSKSEAQTTFHTGAQKFQHDR